MRRKQKKVARASNALLAAAKNLADAMAVEARRVQRKRQTLLEWLEALPEADRERLAWRLINDSSPTALAPPLVPERLTARLFRHTKG
jgi:hypothetical protein